MEPGLVDILIRSRATILDILQSRGYDTTAYVNIAPDQLVTLAEGANSRALDIFVPRGNPTAACDRAVVVHSLHDRIKQKLDGFVKSLWTSIDGKDSTTILQTDDIIVVVNEPWHETFDKVSLNLWQTRRIRCAFFPIKQLVVNPARHVLVPRHVRLTVEETDAEMARWHITSKIQLPQIKMSDIQAKIMGLVPGDVIAVERPSQTAGVARILRNCSA